MSQKLCLHYQSSGRSFYVRPHDIDNIRIRNDLSFGPMLSITVNGREIHITETTERLCELYKLSRMKPWKRKLYTLLNKVFKW